MVIHINWIKDSIIPTLNSQPPNTKILLNQSLEPTNSPRVGKAVQPLKVKFVWHLLNVRSRAASQTRMVEPIEYYHPRVTCC